MGDLNLIHLIQMALGIGLVIFVHEAGHFLAARLCGVRVEVFSLGFGPKVLGWVRRGTLYQVALLPLGGFVRMAGEEPLEAGERPGPDDLRSKSVGQRFLIYSGGVVMNVIFALLVFPAILYWGVPFVPPVIGDVRPGSVAWRAGLEPGSEVLSVNGHAIIDFNFIAHEVALGPPDEARLELLEPGAETPRTVLLDPEYDENGGFNTIGLLPAVDPEGRLEIQEGSPAWQAGLRTDDRLVSLVGPLSELPLEDQFFLATQEGDPLSVEVTRKGHPLTVEVVPEPDPRAVGSKPILGVGVVFNRVLALRENATLTALGLEQDDRLVSVNARPILRNRDLELALAQGADPLVVTVEREGRRLELSAPGLPRAGALSLARDIAVAPDFETNQVVVTRGSAAEEAGLRDGDRILRIDGSLVGTWEEISEHTRRAGSRGLPLDLYVQRAAAPGSSAGDEHFSAVATPRVWLPPSYGVFLRQALYEYRASSLGEAFSVGIKGSWKFLVDAWNTVKRMLLGQVSASNMGGVISIGVVSYSWASLGVAKLLFFLCMLSMNLAFLNVLPIPILDGGHLLFLLIEKAKGSPVSERVFGYSQLIGIVLILSLMIFVTFNDLRRWTGLFD